MVGGLSVIIYLIFIAGAGQYIGDRTNLLWVAYYLSFIVNYPHFTASYALLYRDLGEYFVTDTSNRWFSLRLWWAGLVVPILLVGYFLFALDTGSVTEMGYLVNAMFFFVGWHYVKQIFGCVIVLSAAVSFYYNQWERRLLLATLYLLWGVAYLSNNLYFGVTDFFGIPYSSISVPDGLLVGLQILLGVALLSFGGLMLRRYLSDGRRPPVSAMVAYGAIFLWLLPFFAEPYFFLLIPFFHSLQYLLFVAAYKKNQAAASAMGAEYGNQQAGIKLMATTVLTVLFGLFPMLVLVYYVMSRFESVLTTMVGALAQPQVTVELVQGMVLLLVVGIFWWGLTMLHRRAFSVPYVVQFFVQIIFLGVLLFHLIPSSFDALALRDFLPGVLSYQPEVFGWTLYLFFFTIFINIHHYFVDNVIWRKDNPKVRAYLFANR